MVKGCRHLKNTLTGLKTKLFCYSIASPLQNKSKLASTVVKCTLNCGLLAWLTEHPYYMGRSLYLSDLWVNGSFPFREDAHFLQATYDNFCGSFGSCLNGQICNCRYMLSELLCEREMSQRERWQLMTHSGTNILSVFIFWHHFWELWIGRN